MRKWNILILIVILLIPLVQAELPFCGNMQKINQECRLVTPSMTCSSNATIINGSGNIKTISLNQLNSSIYYINFSESEGDYVIKLCNNATAYIKSIIQTEMEAKDNMFTMFLMHLGIIILLLFFAYISKNSWLAVLNIGLTIFEFGITLFMIYENYAGGDISGLIELNLFVILLVGGILGFMSIVSFMIYQGSTLQTNQRQNTKWGVFWK